MKIGVDFDNTIVCYDSLFHALAREQGLLDASVAVNKGAVRDALRAMGHEETWIALQGEVYGARLQEAEMFPGVLDFFRACHAQGLELAIVSHKTRHPFRGPQYDLHAAARNWLEYHGFTGTGGAPLHQAQVFLELTKQAKCERIAALGCDYFIDDLPEFLQDAAFPPDTGKVLFDPAAAHLDRGLLRFGSWAELLAWVSQLIHN